MPASRQSSPWSARVWLPTACAAVLHVALFPVLYAVTGEATGALALLPIVVAGYLGGARAGGVAALALSVINLGLYPFWIEGQTVEMHVGPTVATAVVFVTIGTAVGRMRDLAVSARSAEARARVLFEAAGDAVLILAPGTERILDANAAALALYGYDDLVGRSMRELSVDTSAGDAASADLVAGSGAQRFSSVQVRRDGTPVHVRISASAATLGGRPVLLSINRDVTAEEAAQRALRARTAELQAITDHTPDFVARFGRDLRYRFVNRAAAAYLGLDAEAFVGRSQAEMGLDAAGAAQREGHLREVFETGRPLEVEYEVPVRGRRRHLHARLVPERGEDGRFETVLAVTRDVTAQREAEAAYRATRAQADRLALVAAKTTNGVVVTDADGLTEWVNDGFTRISGYALDEMRGRKPGRVLQGPGTDPETVAFLHERMRAREPFSAEVLNYHKNGTPYWIHIDVSPLVEDDGALSGFMAIETDVTERKRAEEEAARLRAFYESVLDQNEAEIAVFDRALRYVYVSPSAVADDGLRAWLVGRTNTDYCRYRGLDESLAQTRDAVFRQVFETGEAQTFEETTVGRDGRRRHYVRMICPVRDGGGAVTHVTGYSLDLTEQKGAEAAVRASEARYRDLVETVRDAVLQTDAEGRWTYLNPAWERITGFSVEESLGRSLFDFVHPDERGRHDGLFAPLVREEIPFVRFETRYLTKDGGTRHVEVHAQLRRDGAGAVVGTAGTLTDITDTVRFEAEREARERTEEMLRLKTAFLDNMSHEIRTPLTGILGWAEVLADEVGEDHREPVETIVRGARRLQDTLTSVLDLAQIEAGQFTLDLGPVDLRAEAADAVAVLAETARQRGLALRVEGPPTAARADAAAVGRVLQNLVGNALKFTPSGAVTVRTGADAAGPWLRVADTGIGIDPAFLPRLFDEFAQASTGHARTHEGNGLGLAITQKLVALMGGTVGVESAPGAGSAFTVRLPAPLAEPPAERPAPPAWVAGGRAAVPARSPAATG